MLASMLAILSAACCAAAGAASSAGVHPIEVRGKHFVDPIADERFYIRGVDYQPGGSAAYDKKSDPLSDPKVCARDIALLQQLGVNTVRVYSVNPRLNHDDCMTMLAAANMYLLLDVNTPFAQESLNRYEPWTTYTPQYLSHVFEVVQQFSGYNNTLAFFIGNEIINDADSAAASPAYIRAVARDVKDYMAYNSPRMVPIGYSAADDLRYRTELPDYLTCGDADSAVDFYGVNSYQWCGPQTIRTSGYDKLIADHKNLTLPVFFSEFGCNLVQPRLFQEVGALFSPVMTPYFDGGLVYEYSQELNDYGLVQISPSGDVQLMPDFGTLREQYNGAAARLRRLENARGTGRDNATSAANATAPAAAAPAGTSRGAEQTAAPLRRCRDRYPHLPGAQRRIPGSFGTNMILSGIGKPLGRYNPDILKDFPQPTQRFLDADGEEQKYAVKVVNDFSERALDTFWLPRAKKSKKKLVSQAAAPPREDAQDVARLVEASDGGSGGAGSNSAEQVDKKAQNSQAAEARTSSAGNGAPSRSPAWALLLAVACVPALLV